MDHAGLFIALLVLAPILYWIGRDRENVQNKKTLPKMNPAILNSKPLAKKQSSVSSSSHAPVREFELQP